MSTLLGSHGNRQSTRGVRRGAAAVEFAIAAVPLFMFVFASLEFGRWLMAVQSLEEAARSGCRVAILDGATTTKIEDKIDAVLGPSGISNYNVSVSPSTLGSAPRWSPVTVSVDATYDDMSWLPLPGFIGDTLHVAACTLPREAGNEK